MEMGLSLLGLYHRADGNGNMIAQDRSYGMILSGAGTRRISKVVLKYKIRHQSEEVELSFNINIPVLKRYAVYVQRPVIDLLCIQYRLIL